MEMGQIRTELIVLVDNDDELMSVSYTHLDVYKRQRVHRGQKFSTFPIERCLE